MRWLLCALVAMAALGGGLAQADSGPMAARVNGVEISDWRLQRYFGEFLQERGRNPAAIRSPTLYRQLREEALQQLIDRELLWQEAQRRGIRIEDEPLQAAFDERRQAFGSQEQFSSRLADAGFDPLSYRQYLRQELAAQRMFEVLSQSAAPADEEVRQFLEEHREQLRRPETLRARHILLPAAGAEEERRARVLAGRLRAGEAFAGLARRYSRDASAGAGGDLGYFPRGTMVPEFEAVAFAATPGEPAGPVYSRYGWHLILVEERQPAQMPDEAQALSVVRAWLQRQRSSQAGQAGLQRLRAQARIDLAGRGGIPESGESPGQAGQASPPEPGNVATLAGERF